MELKTKVKTSDAVDFSTVGVAKLLRNLQLIKPLVQSGRDGIPAHLEVTADAAAVGLQLIPIKDDTVAEN